MSILRTVVCLCGIAAAASQPAFQDEVRPSSASGLAPQRRAGAGFQDSAWQAGRKLDQNADARGMYQEPFTLESDADMHAMIDLAYGRMLERLKEQDKDHDGQLRMNNVPELLTLVMNPDNAPLSSAEESALTEAVSDYMRRNGFAVPGRALKTPVKQDFLHGWSTLFFLRDAVPALRSLREAHKASLAAAEAQALRDALKPIEVSAASTSTGSGAGIVRDGSVAADGTFVVSGTVVDFGADTGNVGVDPLLGLLSVQDDAAAATVLAAARGGDATQQAADGARR